jgi:predicted ATPase
MKLKKISLENWKNFHSISVDINDRLFIVGANASGKSNFLDSIRFMRDIVKHGGGLQYAVASRSGISEIRCLSAQTQSDIAILAEFLDDDGVVWKYTLKIAQQPQNDRGAVIQQEILEKGNVTILNRPDNSDKKDRERLTQTNLEQISTNEEFRGIVHFLEAIKCMKDPFSKEFVQIVSKTPADTRNNWLEKIQKILQMAIPQFSSLVYMEDAGQPHLEVTYKHWRSRESKQTEVQLSDGTLRLIGLLWALLDGEGLLLLEEPELSLHTAIIEKLPSLLYSVQCKNNRQIILTTHSAELLSDKSISLSQIAVLKIGKNGTEIDRISERMDIKILLAGGLTPAEVIIPLTQPNVTQGLVIE